LEHVSKPLAMRHYSARNNGRTAIMFSICSSVSEGARSVKPQGNEGAGGGRHHA
jgi:hypothetical protein